MKDEHNICEYEAIYAEYGAYFIESDAIYMNFTARKIPDRMQCTGV